GRRAVRLGVCSHHGVPWVNRGNSTEGNESCLHSDTAAGPVPATGNGISAGWETEGAPPAREGEGTEPSFLSRSRAEIGSRTRPDQTAIPSAQRSRASGVCVPKPELGNERTSVASTRVNG